MYPGKKYLTPCCLQSLRPECTSSGGGLDVYSGAPAALFSHGFLCNSKKSRRELKGQQNRGNRAESLSEGNLALRGSLKGSLRGRLSEFFQMF